MNCCGQAVQRQIESTTYKPTCTTHATVRKPRRRCCNRLRSKQLRTKLGAATLASVAQAAHNDAPSSTRGQWNLEAAPHDGDKKSQRRVKNGLFLAGQQVDKGRESHGVGELALGRGLREEHLAVDVLRWEHLQQAGRSEAKTAKNVTTYVKVGYIHMAHAGGLASQEKTTAQMKTARIPHHL